jgi:hypothetical protein
VNIASGPARYTPRTSNSAAARLHEMPFIRGEYIANLHEGDTLSEETRDASGCRTAPGADLTHRSDYSRMRA